MHADEGIDALIADVNAEAENAQNSQVTEQPKILDEEDSFLNALTAEFNEEESTSPSISPKLAAVMGKIWQGKFNEEQAKASLCYIPSAVPAYYMYNYEYLMIIN